MRIRNRGPNDMSPFVYLSIHFNFRGTASLGDSDDVETASTSSHNKLTPKDLGRSR